VDYHRNSVNSMVARLFRWKYKSKFPENRQLDPYSARYCRHPDRSEVVGDRLNRQVFEIRRGGLSGRLLHIQDMKGDFQCYTPLS